MQDVSIELHIANRKYPLKVKAEEAESAKKAASMVNDMLQKLEKRYGVKDIQDLFAMSALQITTQLIELESASTIDNQADTEKIKALSSQLDAVLNH